MSSAYEQFIKWKSSDGGRRFESALTAAEREQQLKRYNNQYKPEIKKTKDTNNAADDEGVSEKQKEI